MYPLFALPNIVAPEPILRRRAHRCKSDATSESIKQNHGASEAELIVADSIANMLPHTRDMAREMVLGTGLVAVMVAAFAGLIHWCGGNQCYSRIYIGVWPRTECILLQVAA